MVWNSFVLFFWLGFSKEPKGIGYSRWDSGLFQCLRKWQFFVACCFDAKKPKFCKDVCFISFSFRLRECHLNWTPGWKKWWNSMKWKQNLMKQKILRPGEVAFPSQPMKGSVCWFSGRRTCCNKLESMFLPKTPAWPLGWSPPEWVSNGIGPLRAWAHVKTSERN